MKYILWDFDGTLGFRDGMWSGTLHSLLLKNDIINISDNNILEKIKPLLCYGFTYHSPEKSHKELFKTKTWFEYYTLVFKDIFKKLGLNENISDKLSNKVIDEYMDLTKWHIFDDIIDALEKLENKGFKNIILSNHVPELSKIVKGLNIEKYFKGIYSSANIGYEKPNKKIYEYVLKENNLKNTDCIIIGDSYNADIIGGLSMNIKSILVRAENINNYKFYCKNLENIVEKIIEIE